jgi:hypothetical protein
MSSVNELTATVIEAIYLKRVVFLKQLVDEKQE